MHIKSRADKSGQANDRASLTPDISMLRPELQQQWDARGTCTWVQSRSSHKVTSRLCGNAESAQLDSHTSGQHVYRTERKEEAHGAHIGAIGGSACITPLLPWHLIWLSTGITARIKSHRSRCWLAALLRLSGSAQLATGDGKRASKGAPATGLAAPSAAEHSKSTSLSPPFLMLSLPAWPSGTKNTTMQRASMPTTSLLAAISRCTGSACAVQEDNQTAGQQRHTVA